MEEREESYMKRRGFGFTYGFVPAFAGCPQMPDWQAPQISAGKSDRRSGIRGSILFCDGGSGDDFDFGFGSGGGMYYGGFSDYDPIMDELIFGEEYDALEDDAGTGGGFGYRPGRRVSPQEAERLRKKAEEKKRRQAQEETEQRVLQAEGYKAFLKRFYKVSATDGDFYCLSQIRKKMKRADSLEKALLGFLREQLDFNTLQKLYAKGCDDVLFNRQGMPYCRGTRRLDWQTYENVLVSMAGMVEDDYRKCLAYQKEARQRAGRRTRWIVTIVAALLLIIGVVLLAVVPDGLFHHRLDKTIEYALAGDAEKCAAAASEMGDYDQWTADQQADFDERYRQLCADKEYKALLTLAEVGEKHLPQDKGFLAEYFAAAARKAELDGNLLTAAKKYDAAGEFDKSYLEEAKRCRYEKAEAFFNEEQYYAAADLFDTIAPYRDAGRQGYRCRYAAAMELYTKGRYTEAERAFAICGQYKDSRKYLLMLEAKRLAEEGSYSSAYMDLRSLKSFAPAKKLRQSWWYRQMAFLEGKSWHGKSGRFHYRVKFKNGNLYFSRELEKDVEWLGMLDKDYRNYGFYDLVKVQENGKWLMKYEEVFGEGEVRIRSFSEEYMEITDKWDAVLRFEYIKATLQRLYE